MFSVDYLNPISGFGFGNMRTDREIREIRDLFTTLSDSN